MPRHEFVLPGTPLAEAYGGSIVRTKKAADGATLSSVSGAWLQARMIAQAGVRPGLKVLEIGSGGYNAALLAEITGRPGRVVSIDIDPEITGRNSTGCCLTRPTTGSGRGLRYPPTLLVTFGGDTRVAAMHARKMCAALQHADACGGPVLLHQIEGIGHGAKPGRPAAEATATVLGFLARHTGLIPAPSAG